MNSYNNYYNQQPPTQQYNTNQPNNNNINYNVSPVQEKTINLKEIIKKIKPTLSTSSIKIYTTNLSKLYKYVNNTYDNEILNLNFIYDKKKIDQFLESKALKTKANYYTNIITLYNYVLDIEKNEDPKIQKLYYEFVKKKQAYNYEIKQNTIKRNHSKAKQEKVISIEKYNDFLKELKKEHFQDFVIFYLLKYFPYRNETATIRIIQSPVFKEQYNTKIKRQSKPKDYQNIITHDIKNEAFYIIRNDYKTARTYGEITSEISKENNKNLYKILHIWINRRGTNDYLFTKNGGQDENPFTGSDLSAHLGYISRKYLDVKLTTASIFKIIIANFKGNPGEMLDFIEEKGDQRGTNTTTLINFYVYKKNEDLGELSE